MYSSNYYFIRSPRLHLTTGKVVKHRSMFEIKYEVANQDELIDPDEVSLRTRHFLGNLVLKNDNFSIFVDQQKIPIIDSAFNILRICRVLIRKKDGIEEVEFMHSAKRITFQKKGAKIKIIPSFSVVTLEVPVDDFKEGTKQFFQNVIQDAMKKNHSLIMNERLFGYLHEAENI